MIAHDRETLYQREKRRGELWMWWVSFCVLFSLWVGYAAPAEAKTSFRVRGYAESRYTGLLGLDLGSLCEGDLLPPLQQFCNMHILVNRIRPSALVKFSRKIRLRVTANLLTSHFRLERDVTKIDDLLTLARLYMEIRTRYVDIRAGKQAFNWGPAQLWSLTTPFVPQDPTDLNAELPGLWAVSARINYNPTGFFYLGAMAAPDFSYTLEFLRWKQTFGNTDIALVAVEGGPKRRLTFGAELKTTIVLGFWIEAAMTIPYQRMIDNESGADPTFSFVVGVDYSFPVLESLVVSLQYYYNHSGITDPKKYPFNTPEGLAAFAAALQQTSQSNNITGIGLGGGGYIGAHYLFLSGNLTILEGLSVAVTAIGNILDPSVLVGPFVNWTFLDDFTLTLGAYFLLGPQGSEFAPGKLKIPVTGIPEDGINVSPVAAAFAWIRYNY